MWLFVSFLFFHATMIVVNKGVYWYCRFHSLIFFVIVRLYKTFGREDVCMLRKFFRRPISTASPRVLPGVLLKYLGFPNTGRSTAY